MGPMSTRRAVSSRWVFIGAGTMVGLNVVMRALLADPVRTQLISSFSGMTGVFVFVAIIAFFSYFVGGAVIGLLSPGETIREPAYAALIATGLNTLENLRNIDGQAFTLLDWFVGSAIVLGVGFSMALGGGWVGERIQGRTVEKMRESNDGPGSRPA